VLVRRDELERTAYHESGHMVMGYTQGAVLGSVEMQTEVPDPRPVERWQIGRCTVRSTTGRCSALVDLGGPAAQMIGEGLDLTLLAASFRYYLDAREDFQHAGTHFIEVELECLWADATDLLRRNWPRVQAVAGALLGRHRLSGEEVRRIIRSTPELPSVERRWVGY